MQLSVGHASSVKEDKVGERPAQPFPEDKVDEAQGGVEPTESVGETGELPGMVEGPNEGAIMELLLCLCP